jgi:hypothetical protein
MRSAACFNGAARRSHSQSRNSVAVRSRQTYAIRGKDPRYADSPDEDQAAETSSLLDNGHTTFAPCNIRRRRAMSPVRIPGSRPPCDRGA